MADPLPPDSGTFIRFPPTNSGSYASRTFTLFINRPVFLPDHHPVDPLLFRLLNSFFCDESCYLSSYL
jgi:hypothetical protein